MMTAELTSKLDWFAIDGDNGITYLPADLLPSSAIDAMNNGDYTMFRPYYYDGQEIHSVTILQGYGVRSTMPGYLDCTDWTVYSSLVDAKAAYRAEGRANRGEE